MFRLGKIPGNQEEEKRGRKIEKKGDDNPKFLGIVDKKYCRILDLAIEEQQAINDDQDCLNGCRGGIETGDPALQKIDNRDRKENQRADDGYIFQPTILNRLIKKYRQKGIFDDSESCQRVKNIDLKNSFQRWG